MVNMIIIAQVSDTNNLAEFSFNETFVHLYLKKTIQKTSKQYRKHPPEYFKTGYLGFV